MRLLIDADAISKLAHWDVLNELSPFTGIPSAETATLTSVRHRASRACAKPDVKLFLDVAAAERARAYCAQLGQLPEPDPDFIALLQNASGIDSGEAVLLAILAREPQARLLTGDKKALTALVRTVPQPALASLTGRCLIVEQVLLACLHQHGIEWLRSRVCPYRSRDKAIAIVMGSECQASRADVEMGLTSYIQDVTRTTARLLTPDPFAHSSR